MPFNPNNSRNFLEFRKKELEDKLRRMDAETMDEYLFVCGALAGGAKMEVKQVIDAHEYVGYRNAIDAIKEHLKKVNDFMDEEELIKAVIDGGWGPKDERRVYNVKDSIRYWVKFRKNKSGEILKPLLMRRGGKIGLIDWAAPGELEYPEGHSNV